MILVRIAAATATSLMTVSVVGQFDKFGGAVVGLVFGSLIASLLLIGILAMPFDAELKKEVKDNPFTGPLLHMAPALYDASAGLWGGEDFFEMIEDRLEPLAGEARESIRAFMGEAEREDSGEN